MRYGDFHGPLDVLVDAYKSETSGSGATVSAITAEINRWKDLAQAQTAKLARAQAELERLKSEAVALAGQAGGLLNLAGDPTRLLEWIRIESAYGPTLEMKGPFLGPKDAGPSILASVKPKITLKFKPLPQVVVIQPYGAPDPTLWPYILFGVGAVAGAAGGGILLGRIGAVGGALLTGTALTHFGR